jgi:uncharacterized cupredoxin-like copper-binding protein
MGRSRPCASRRRSGAHKAMGPPKNVGWDGSALKPRPPFDTSRFVGWHDARGEALMRIKRARRVAERLYRSGAQICSGNRIACIDAPAYCIADAACATLRAMRTWLGTARGRMLARMLAAAVLALSTATLGAGADSHGMTMPMEMGYTGDHDYHGLAFAFGAPARPKYATRTVRITVTDASFEPGSLTVRAGEIVRFVVTNVSGLDHEFVLGDAATQKAHRAEMASMAAAGQAMDHDHPNAATVAPKQTATLTWKFTRPGVVEYDCDIPGHYEAGMKGVIKVQ